MNSALIIEVVALLLGFYYMGQKKQDKARKNYIIIIMSLLILESGLRAITVGPDTGNYYNAFERCKYLTWSDVFDNTMEDRDSGFGFVMKLCQVISDDFNVFLTIAALWFFIPLGGILYRYSNHIFQLIFAFTLYIALFHIIALSGIRQQIAMGFSFWAFLFFDKKRFIVGSLLLLVGSTIHVSLLLFSAVPIIYFFVNSKYYKNIHLATILSIPVVFVSAKLLIVFMAGFLSDDYYMAYAEKDGSGAVVYIILMELLSVFCYMVIKKEYVLKNEMIAYLYVNLPLLTFFVPLITLDGTLIRLGQYFTIYMMLLYPYAVDMFAGKKSRSLLYSISITVLVLLMLKSPMIYEFCF